MATEQRILISVNDKFYLTVHRAPLPRMSPSSSTIANCRRWWTTITDDSRSVHVPICGRTTYDYNNNTFCALAEESPWAVQRGWVVEVNKSNAGMTKVKSRIIHLIPFRYYFLLHTLAYIWFIKLFTTDNKSLNPLVGGPPALTDRKNCGREHQQNMIVRIKSIEWKTSAARWRNSMSGRARR